MEKEILEIILSELFEETKKTNVLMEEQNKEIQELKTADHLRKNFILDTLADYSDLLLFSLHGLSGTKNHAY